VRHKYEKKLFLVNEGEICLREFCIRTKEVKSYTSFAFQTEFAGVAFKYTAILPLSHGEILLAGFYDSPTVDHGGNSIPEL
jgi:hypothetical protein